jgi:SnoaL-like domain
MKIIFRVVIFASVVALGVWLWTVLFPSPQKIVLKKVAALAATATVGARDGNITRATKVSNLIGYFSADAEVNCDVPEIEMHTLTGRDEIRQVAAVGMTQLSTLTVQFHDAVAHVALDKQSAVVTCTAHVSIGDNKDFGIQEVDFHFQKIDGDWLITRAETVKTLR